MTASRLDDAAIAEALAGIDGWRRDGGAIHKEFVAAGFPDAIAFITRLAFDAERMNHHPEIENVWNRVTIRLTTHDADGLTELDFALAAKIDAAF